MLQLFLSQVKKEIEFVIRISIAKIRRLSKLYFVTGFHVEEYFQILCTQKFSRQGLLLGVYINKWQIWGKQSTSEDGNAF